VIAYRISAPDVRGQNSLSKLANLGVSVAIRRLTQHEEELNMRNLVVFGLVLLLLALNCEAMAPVQLTGAGGKDILTKIANTNITTQPTKASTSDLWNWGTVPLGNVLENGKLVSIGDDGTSTLFYPLLPTNATTAAQLYQLSNQMAAFRVAPTDLLNPDLNGDVWSAVQFNDQPVLSS
jgi:hypothetical protein